MSYFSNKKTRLQQNWKRWLIILNKCFTLPLYYNMITSLTFRLNWVQLKIREKILQKKPFSKFFFLLLLDSFTDIFKLIYFNSNFLFIGFLPLFHFSNDFSIFLFAIASFISILFYLFYYYKPTQNRFSNDEIVFNIYSNDISTFHALIPFLL